VFTRLLSQPSRTPPREQQPKPSLAALATLIALTRAYPDRFVATLRSGIGRAAVQRFTEIYSRPTLTWEQLEFLRQRTSLPILLKGILHPDDASRAIDAGMDGIVVSNHGGRQVDGAIAALDALPGIVDAVGDQVDVLFDSGIRTGADIVKALALGARAVLIGRPFVYGLALGGEDGVRHVLRCLLADLDLTLALSGHRRPADLSAADLCR
jgi:isopentenyl diphosphate isomerase/L-lactate dehydrogenase-like FMN-dependent dehydrogenase